MLAAAPGKPLPADPRPFQRLVDLECAAKGENSERTVHSTPDPSWSRKGARDGGVVADGVWIQRYKGVASSVSEWKLERERGFPLWKS